MGTGTASDAVLLGTHSGMDLLGTMLANDIVHFLRQSGQSLWLRPAIYAGMAVATLGLAPMLARFIPDGLDELIGLDGVYDLLNALANTLLAVAIFSLGILASSIQAAASAASSSSDPAMRSMPRSASGFARVTERTSARTWNPA